MKDKNKSRTIPGEKKDGVTIANLISILGLVALAFCLYLGFAYSGNNTGSAILYALLLTVLVGLILYAMLYSKAVENNFKKWRIVEWSLTFFFIGGCVALTPILCKFININNDSENLKYHALQDLNMIEGAISDFQNAERANLSQLTTNLNMVASSPNYMAATTPELRKFITEELGVEENRGLTKEDVKAFTDKWNGYIENLHHYGEHKSYGATIKNAITENKERINQWKILEIPQAIEGIDALLNQITPLTESISKSYPLHQIGRSGTRWDIVENHYPGPVNTHGEFKKELTRSSSGWNFSGIALSVAIFLMIIFNYIVAYRSSKVSVKAGASLHDGGMILKN